jgi:peroxiredoxin
VATRSTTVHVGDRAPDFTLEAAGGGSVTLSEEVGHPVVLVFLRGFG